MHQISYTIFLITKKINLYYFKRYIYPEKKIINQPNITRPALIIIIYHFSYTSLLYFKHALTKTEKFV